MAESRPVRYSRFSDTTLANVRTNWTTWSYGTLTDPPSSLAGIRAACLAGCSDAPAQPRSLDRRVPQLRELVVQLEQRDREPGHLERRDVRADQVPGDLDAPSRQELVHLVVHDVELDEGRAAHAVHERQDFIPLLVRDVLHDGDRHHLHDLVDRLELHPLPAGLAVDPDADLYLVVADLEGGLASRRHRARGQGHPHAPPVRVHVPCDRRVLLQGTTYLRRRPGHLLQDHGRADA